MAKEPPRPLDRDPVCGRELTKEQALLTTDVCGREYLFCSERCRMLFTIRPAGFVDRVSTPAKRASRE